VTDPNVPDLKDRPRWVSALNRESPSRLYDMVLKLNEAGKSS